MSNQHSVSNLGVSVTFNPEDIPGNLTLDQWDTIEDISGKQKLLVTIGDSWTWGDSLSEQLADYDLNNLILADTNWDHHLRKQRCYGSHLSRKLNADWINYGFPGYSNIYILERFAMILNDPRLNQYHDTYFVLCLTETGREYAWLPDPNLPPPVSVDQFAAMLEQQVIDKILECYGSRDLSKLIICRNFTSSYPTTQYHTKHLKTWVELNWEQNPMDFSFDQVTVYGPATQMGIEPLWFLSSYEQYLRAKYQLLEGLYSFLEQSPYHCHKATKHPTAQSHLLWAEYLAQQFAQMR